MRNRLSGDMKDAHVLTVVRIPVASIAADVAESHSIRLPFDSARMEDGVVVLTFGASPMGGDLAKGPPPAADGTTAAPMAPPEGPPESMESGTPGSRRLPRRRRRGGKRNRMKTRGWNVVTKRTNSHGQTVTIYEPFVKSLQQLPGPRRKKEEIVAEILRANGNRPGRDSVRYYLENTLEYLSGREEA